MERKAITGFRKAGQEGLGEEHFITTKCYTLELVSLRRGNLLRNKSLQPSWLSFSKRVSILDTKKGCGG